jgi:alpha-L-fucosidase
MSLPSNKFTRRARDKAGDWVQFAPKLKSAGGSFDPGEWAQLFADAGARNVAMWAPNSSPNNHWTIAPA